MSDQVRSRKPVQLTDDAAPPLTKSEKRALAKEAKARAAAAKRRREALTGTFAGLAVVAVIVGIFLYFNNRSDDPADTATPPAATPTAAADNPAAPEPGADGEFPPLPDGADPALGSKPTVSAGTGAVTKLTPTVLIEGTGPAAQAGQQITVNYVGVTHKDGQEFDASWNQSRAFPFQLGAGQVIPGWDQGLVGIKVGSRVQLDIPADLAYGDPAPEGYPSGALRFVVDVLAVG